MTSIPTSKHVISQFVRLFFLATPSFHIKEAWIKDTSEAIMEELWAIVLDGIKVCSINARL